MSAMAKIEIKHVQAFTDRHGRRRHYFRKPGARRVSLPGEPGSSAFMTAYGEALAADPASKLERLEPRSIHHLIALYYTTRKFKDLEDSTKRTYRNMLDRFRNEHGDKSAVKVQTKHLDRMFDEMSDRPGAMRNLRKRLRVVFRLAVKEGWRADNPVNETDAPESGGDGFTPWSEADIAAFEGRWPTGSRERLALALLLYTGQRRSDVVGMGRQHLESAGIRVKQIKTGAPLVIPLHPELQTEIDAAPLGMTFMLTQYGKPFSGAGFSQWFRERAEDAGLKGRTPHGLRKAAARRLAEAGCTSKEIAAITGHKTLSEVERYTRDADQGRLAGRAMTKLRGES